MAILVILSIFTIRVIANCIVLPWSWNSSIVFTKLCMLNVCTVYVLVGSTENIETLRFQKYISEIQFITQYSKNFCSENFPLYGTIYDVICNLPPVVTK